MHITGTVINIDLGYGPSLGMGLGLGEKVCFGLFVFISLRIGLCVGLCVGLLEHH
jgi:hypothetical protein